MCFCSLPLRGAAIICLIALGTVLVPKLSAQAVPPPTAPTARPEDVRSLDAIVAALYASISGKVGEKRDWNRMRSLFAPDARLIPLTSRAVGSAPRMLSVEDYILTNGPAIETNGFSERELARRSEEFGRIVHVWSTYAGTVAAPGAAQPARGINSIQLVNDGSRFWIVNVFWDSETPATPLPAKYLPLGNSFQQPNGGLDQRRDSTQLKNVTPR